MDHVWPGRRAELRTTDPPAAEREARPPITAGTVAGLRALVGPDVDDPRLNELVGELSVRSERFRQLWARHDARLKRSGTTRLDHSLVGPLQLSYEKLPIPDTDRQTLGVYHARLGLAAPAPRRSRSLPRLRTKSANRFPASTPSSARPK